MSSIYLILPAAPGPGVYPAPNRGLERGGCVGLTTLLPSVSRLSGQCGILNVSQPYRPPQPVTGIAFFFSMWQIGSEPSVKSKQRMYGETGRDLRELVELLHGLP
jgi:hypothetical protein